MSTLVGPSERALTVWTEWIHRRGASVVIVDGDDVRGVVAAWAATLARERNLEEDAESFVLRHQPAGQPRTLRFQGKTAHERRVLLEGLTPPPHAHAATWELCQALLEAPAPVPPGVLPEAIRQAIARAPLPALQALLALAPDGRTPALRVRTGPSDFRALRTAAALCAAAPTLTTGCVLAPEALAEHLRRGESHVLAMLREGRLDLAHEVTDLPGASGVEAVAATRARLRQEGASEQVVSLYDSAARTLASAYTDADGRARSEAEKFLHARLQEHPATRGLFVLNGRVSPSTGGRPLEVDLLCAELRLAVELDGYFHFRNPDGFRRDRRKDMALQCAGYWVVRFLADDVVARLEEILETLDTLIATRRGELTGKDSSYGKR